MQEHHIKEIINTPPFSVGSFEIDTTEKLKLKRNSCLIALHPDKAQLIVNGELIPLSNGDIIQSSKDSQISIIGRSKFISFNGFEGEDGDGIKILNLSKLTSSYFYSNKKLTLQKIGEEDVLCLSQDNDFIVKINMQNELATIIGDT